MSSESFISNTLEITPRQTMRGHTGQVHGVAHLPGGRHSITCSLDGSLRLWDLESGAQIGEDWRDENDVWSIALSPNGKIAASGGGDRNVRLWDVEARKVMGKWAGHSDVVCSLCWSTDGNRVASGSWDGIARVWDVDSGKTILTIKTGHEWVYAVTYSPDSSKLATGGDEENAVKIWDAKTGKCLKTLEHRYRVCSLTWTSDGEKLVSGSNGPIRIFDTTTWQQIATLGGHIDFVTAISLSRNNRLLASVSNDRTARLWNLDTNLPVGPLIYHGEKAPSTVLSPDAKLLVTACEDNTYTWDVHAILREAGLEDLLPIGINIAPKDTQKQIAPQDDSGIQHTPRSSLSDKSFLEADATQCPAQYGSVDDLPTGFFAGMEADVDFSPMGSAHPHSSVNALLTRLSSLLHHFRPENGEAIELPRPSRSSVFHRHALLARFSSLIHNSPPENDAQDELQPPSRSSRSDPRVLLARLSSLFPRSQLNTDDETEPHSTTPLSSRPDALINRLSSLFRSQPHANEEIKLTQRPSRPHVVEVAAVRDKKALVVARGPQFEKAKRAYEQAKLDAHAQPLSSHTQPADASTSVTPAPGTAAAQPPPIQWWAQIVLFLCCASPSHANGH